MLVSFIVAMEALSIGSYKKDITPLSSEACILSTSYPTFEVARMTMATIPELSDLITIDIYPRGASC